MKLLTKRITTMPIKARTSVEQEVQVRCQHIIILLLKVESQDIYADTI